MPLSPLAAPALPARRTAPPNNLGLQIQQKLRERILHWHYPPGHHLGEQELCDELSASRIPVREALRALAEQGLVDQIPNRGCFVQQPDAERINQLYEFRLALELFVVDTLAPRGLPPELVARQRSYWEPLQHITPREAIDGTALVRADEAFHLELAQTLGNPYIIDSLKDTNDRLRFVRLVVTTTPNRIRTTASEHLKILLALARKDGEKARHFLRQNLQHARNKVETAIARALTAAHRRQR
jgi:DNA-binding GntR family transcriptional regulator